MPTNESFRQDGLVTRYTDRTLGICWSMIAENGPQRMTMPLLSSLQDEQSRFVDGWARGDRVAYHGFGSRSPRVFSLGGDLRGFVRAARQRDRAWLKAYAHLAVNVIHGFIGGYGLPVRTIALVQGLALGGGFEAALSANIIVAERQAVFSFPETRFGLFPGMGAWQLLCLRLSPRQAEDLIASGRRYSAEELYRIGVVDVLAEQGQGMEAVRRYVQSEQAGVVGIQAMRSALYAHCAPCLDDLIEQVNDWVERVMQLPKRNLGLMEKLTDISFSA